MNKKELIHLYARIGVFFGACDGHLDVVEEEVVRKKLKDLIKKESVNIDEKTLNETIQRMKEENFTFEKVVEETKKTISSLSQNNRQKLLSSLDIFINKIILADDVVDENETKFFEKWQEAFSENSQKDDEKNDKDIISLYARIGLFFGACDGHLDEEEEEVVRKRLSDFVKEENVHIGNADLEAKIEAIKKENLPFESVIAETKDFMKDFSEEERERLLSNLNIFINKIILADDVIDENETEFFEKWQEAFSENSQANDEKDIISLYARIGLFFGACDGHLDEEEEEVVRKRLNDFVKEENIHIENADLEAKIEAIKKENLPFESVVAETKEFMKDLPEDQKEKLLANLSIFINKIILADDVIDENETKFFEKWQEAFQNLPPALVENNTNIEKPAADENEVARKKSRKMTANEKKSFPVLTLILFLAVFAVIGISAIRINNTKTMKKKLQELPLSLYTKKALQFKEIDFSKVLIYGTDSTQPDEDSLLIYFVKGTASLKFTGLDNIEIDYENTDYEGKNLHLIYNIPANATELPVEIDVTFDENKCRLIENINAKPISEGYKGKMLEFISTVAGTVAGGMAGNAIGTMFGMKGKIVGTVAGAVVGGTGSYLLTSNFCKKTSIVKKNNAETVVDLFEEAGPVIASQLLYDDYTASNPNDETKQKDYIQQQIANTLSELITSGESDWDKVTIRFVENSVKEANK